MIYRQFYIEKAKKNFLDQPSQIWGFRTTSYLSIDLGSTDTFVHGTGHPNFILHIEERGFETHHEAFL